MDSGLVFNIQRFSVHDGPGVRTTVFLKGCPARCAWCHNPESQAPGPELLTFPERCIQCGTCGRVCAGGADPARCTACGSCVDPCPADARQLAGRRMTASEVLEIVARDRVFYEESGGGVTFSGGEPLAQPAFLRALLAGARATGLSTAVDTCGFAARDLLLRIAPFVDVFLYDIKVLDAARHQELVGIPLAPVLSNLRALAAVHACIWLRVPVIRPFNDDDAGMEAIARLAATLTAVRRVSLLPYHSMGTRKLGRQRRVTAPDRTADLSSPGDRRMAHLAGLFRAHGLDVRIGG